jgi:ABC-type transport system substrate-binding protein
MRRFALALVAASNLLLAPAHGAVRPRYGGTLRVASSVAPATLDPAEFANSVDGRNLAHLIFDVLVELDRRGMPQPALAASWEAEPGRQRWQFHLRPGVTFDDGTALTPELAAAALRTSNAAWRVSAAGDAVVIELAVPGPNLPAELALIRNSIVKRGGGKIHGTGPFTVTQWDPGKRLALTAKEDYWRGRPFVNSVDVELGKNSRDQRIEFDLGKLDLIDVAPEQAKQTAAEGKLVVSSAPVEMLALVFARDPQAAEETRFREALSLSIDRATLNNGLLRGGGETSASLLPNWMTGYGFVFPASPDADRARQLRTGLHQATPWTLGYDTSDPIARLMSDRIILNARDAGVALQPVTTGSPDVRLVRIALSSLEPRTALTVLAAACGMPSPKYSADGLQDLYAAERSLLQSQRVIPLLHLRINYPLGASVRNWTMRPDGIWSIPDVWLGPEKP